MNSAPTPEPDWILEVRQWLQDRDNAHAAAVTAAKDAEIAKLKTVMIAAAEEIQAHWDAHCDAEGYGPANLMRRLEEGIPSQYGYTAGAFEQLRERVRVLEDALRLALAELDELPAWSNAGYVCNIARAALEQTGHNARLTCPQGREEKA